MKAKSFVYGAGLATGTVLAISLFWTAVGSSLASVPAREYFAWQVLPFALFIVWPGSLTAWAIVLNESISRRLVLVAAGCGGLSSSVAFLIAISPLGNLMGGEGIASRGAEFVALVIPSLAIAFFACHRIKTTWGNA